ncbi:MAG: hypothetical protein ACP5FP_02095 [Desulfuromonadaceae bacterium]
MHMTPGNICRNWFQHFCIPILTALILLTNGGKETVEAKSTIQCHCFQNRIFDTDKPGAADAYYLATTHNAFYAQAGDASKKIIVRSRQRGLLEDDLWIAFAVSREHSISLKSLLTTRLQHTEWNSTLQALGIETGALKHELRRAIEGKSSNITAEVLDHTLVNLGLISATHLQELRALNANAKEVLASVLLQIYGEKAAPEYLREARSGAHWDRLMHNAGIKIAQVEQLWDRALNRGQKA